MRKLRRITAILLCMLLCMGAVCISASAAKLDYTDGYLEITDANGNYFSGTYQAGTTLEYHLTLFVYDEESDDYVQTDILPTDVVTVNRVDEETENKTVMANGTGDIISWTPAENGPYHITVQLNRDNYVFEGMEVHWIGTPIDVNFACGGMYAGPVGLDGAYLYTGKSIKKDFVVYDYFNETTLVEGKDYKISMTNTKGPGKGVVTITGKGNYSGTVTEEYEIINPSAKFKDVKQNGWYVGAINYALDSELFNGTSSSTFEPDARMTRGMFVTVIGRFLGWQEYPTIDSGFADVKSGQYYTKFVAYAAALGIVTGVDATHFAPNDPITREQMCAMIVRVNNFLDAALKETELEIKLEMTVGGQKFADHKSISSYARDAVYSCRNAGVVNGKPGNQFDPKGNATRAEVATIVYNYAQYIVKSVAGDYFE